MNEQDAPSFDPHTWVSAETSKMSDTNQPFAPAQPSPMAKPGLSPRAVALAVSLIFALGGAAIALLSRPATPARPLPPGPSRETTAPAVDTAPFLSRRTLVLRNVAEIAPVLVSARISPGVAEVAIAQVAAAIGQEPGEIRLTIDLESYRGETWLNALKATRADGTGLLLHRGADNILTAQKLSRNLTTRLRIVRGEIDSNSFYTSAVAAGVTDSLISEVANAFSFDFDMQREVAPGDVLEVAFEQAYNPSDEPVGVPRLAYVSLRTASLSRTLYRFVPPGERTASWFDGNGSNTVRALMRTPVDSARITSRFGMRSHPILGYQKLHRGTDFAAPTGTPVFASGSATVQFAGMKGANGNFVRLLHDNGWQTLYLHMNRILPGIEPGVKVAQGQQIGEIGTTGRSTGPHLHYEVHIDGQPTDPLLIDTGKGQSLTGDALAAFHKQRDKIDAGRAAAKY